MDRVEDLSENILSTAIYNLIPVFSGIQVRNRLLDGSLHIQTIGDPTKSIRFKCVSNNDSINILNNFAFSGQEIKVFFDDIWYIGLIDYVPDWQEQLFGEKDVRLYSSLLVVVVSQEGDIP